MVKNFVVSVQEFSNSIKELKMNLRDKISFDIQQLRDHGMAQKGCEEKVDQAIDNYLLSLRKELKEKERMERDALYKRKEYILNR